MDYKLIKENFELATENLMRGMPDDDSDFKADYTDLKFEEGSVEFHILEAVKMAMKGQSSDEIIASLKAALDTLANNQGYLDIGTDDEPEEADYDTETGEFIGERKHKSGEGQRTEYAMKTQVKGPDGKMYDAELVRMFQLVGRAWRDRGEAERAYSSFYADMLGSSGPVSKLMPKPSKDGLLNPIVARQYIEALKRDTNIARTPQAQSAIKLLDNLARKTDFHEQAKKTVLRNEKFRNFMNDPNNETVENYIDMFI